MSRIEQLIAELCPDGVEFKELGECLKRTKGTPITAKQMSKKNKVKPLFAFIICIKK